MVAYTVYPTDTRVRREAEALAARGDKVTVISLASSNGKSIPNLNGVRWLPLSQKRYRGSQAGAYLSSYLAFFCRAALRLAVLHLKQPFHIIQVHTLPDFMVFTALVPKLSGARVILDVHDLMPELYRSKFGLDEQHPLIRLITWIERASIGFADRAIAVHKVQREVLVRHGNPPGKFIELLNLPDPALFSRNTSSPVRRREAGLRLIYHGTISNRHGLQVLLKAMAILASELQGLELHMIGDGDAVPALLHLRTELGLSRNVRFSPGFIPPEEIVPLLLAADAGVVPTIVDAFTRFMLPVKLLEYVALGLPVICSRTRTVEAYFDDGMVCFFRPGDPYDLAQVIRDLYWNPDRRAEICSQAERFNRDYRWDQHKSSYFRLVDELVGRMQSQIPSQARLGWRKRLRG
jgi:glycosyltransferase involved in cell wall biosynthesis